MVESIYRKGSRAQSIDVMTIIADAHTLNQLCEEITASGRFALDLEFIPERTYAPVLCLIQVATDSGVHLVDPLAEIDLNPLWQKLTEPNLRAVLHAASQDLDLIYKLAGIVPVNVFDTQLAAGFAGLGYQVGYARLVNQLLGVTVAKTESFTDWLTRPLTEAQIAYATDDVRHLLPLFDKISERLNSMGRFSWAEEECKKYHDPEFYHKEKEIEFFKVKGASGLDRRSLAVLKQLFEWRDKTAARLDRPQRSLISDSILVELSRKPPTRMEDLQRMRGLRPDQLRGFGNGILQAASRALAIPHEEWPTWPSARVPPKREVLIGDLLFAVMKVIAYEENLATELISTRDDLQTLVKAHREKKLDQKQIPLLQGWRYELAGEKMLALLEGSDLIISINGSEDAPVDLRFEKRSS
ncbi:MAG TPA: ribonuclease D [Candidatus Obscuribacterales bacterium]